MHQLRPITAKLTAAILALGGLALSAKGQFNYTETFKNSTAAGWNFYSGNSSPGVRLTSGAAPVAADPEFGSSTIDPTGQGWLRLATTTANQANAAYFNAALPSSGNDITVKFSVAMWGDKGIATGGDGLTFFMRDASQDFSVGAFGGSIGYAQKSGIDGVAGGYFGVAFDVFGNYSNPTEGRSGGVGAVPNAVVVRGPGDGQTGYDYLSGTGGYNYTATGSATAKNSGDPAVAALPYSLSFPTANDRPDQTTSYRNVEITLSSASLLTVKMQFGETGTWNTVLTANMSSFARPDMMSFGFSAGTGDANQVYEVGNTFSVNATAAANTYFWDNGSTANASKWLSGSTDAAKNWVGNTNPTSGANIMFNDTYVSSNQTVKLTSGNETVGSVYFSGKYSYNVTADSNSKLIFDAPGTESSYISMTNAASGNVSHTIGSNIQMNNDLTIFNYEAGQTLTMSGAVATGGNDLSVYGPGSTTFNGAVSGGGTLTKLNDGLLTFASTASVSNLVLDGGTLKLDSATLTASNLHVTGNSIIDFGTGAASYLGLASLTIDSGVILTIANWTDALDYFFVNAQPSAGTLSQIVFSGYSNPTGWRSLDKSVRPVPEPATYGAIFIGGMLVLFFWYNRREEERKKLRAIPVRSSSTPSRIAFRE